MKKKLRKIVCVLLAVIILLPAGSFEETYAAELIKCYTISSGYTTCYKNSSLSSGSKLGTIYPTDELIVREITQRYCKVTYPVSRGTKTGYIPTSAILLATSGYNKIAAKQITTYRRKSTAKAYGYISKGDEVLPLGTSGSFTQVYYPVSGGHKIAWIRSSEASWAGQADTQIFPDGDYRFECKGGKRIDIDNASKSDGANVQLWEKNDTSAQIYHIEYCGNGYYKIVNVGSGKVLDVDGGNAYTGANVIQYSWHGGSNQMWKIVPSGESGYYEFLSAANNGKALDINGGANDNGTNIQVWDRNGTDAQKWRIVSYSGGSSNQGSNANTAVRIAQYAESQVGIGDYRGNNNVKYNTWYYGRTISGNGYAWCQAFVSYCANQMGVLNTAIPKTASCQNAVNWFKTRGRFYNSQYYGGSYIPKQGDLVFYTDNKRTSSHVGIVVAAPSNGYLKVVEGNVRTNSGDYRVCKFTANAKRRLNSSYVMGYASPAY